jgi:hypothetical protein
MLLLAGSAVRIWTKKLAVTESCMCVSEVRLKGLICTVEKNVTV